jgi:hypothetical protein
MATNKNHAIILIFSELRTRHALHQPTPTTWLLIQNACSTIIVSKNFFIRWTLNFTGGGGGKYAFKAAIWLLSIGAKLYGNR